LLHPDSAPPYAIANRETKIFKYKRLKRKKHFIDFTAQNTEDWRFMNIAYRTGTSYQVAIGRYRYLDADVLEHVLGRVLLQHGSAALRVHEYLRHVLM
jgi:hypothetical protein